MERKAVEEILDDIDYEFARTAPPATFPNLPRIPARRYLDRDLYEAELGLFRRSWLFAGTVHEFPAVGSYKVMDKWGGASVVLVKGQDQRIRAFWNVCQHRGGPVVPGENGTLASPNLKCVIHSWVYDLEGNLKGVPGRRDFHNDFDAGAMHLKHVQCDVWQGFVFINLDPDAPPLKDWFGPIHDEVSWFDGLRVANRGTKVLECNWKVAIEANIEVYHINTVHPETVALSLDYRGSAHQLLDRGHSRMVVPNRGYDAAQARADVARADIPVNGLMKHVNVSYLLFPNHLTPSQNRRPDGVPTLTLQQFWPLGIDRTLSEWYVMLPDWGDRELSDEEKRGSVYYGVVMDEDTAMLDQIQKAMQTQVLDGFLTSYHERRIYHHEASVDRALGERCVPADMRVPQILPLEG
ncbi:MAG: aromatic ring-hydroxylating dioxygenase subunit alpha [Pseudomonadales bacterium]